MASKIIECRWGILGCGSEAASFVAELQSSNVSSSASGNSSLQVRHVIVAISSSSASISRAFADSHLHRAYSITTKTTASMTASSTSPASTSSSLSSSLLPTETFGTSTELHAHPSIDSIFIASPQHTRYQEALSALRGGKSVLISKPLAISSIEGKELCDLASRKEKDNKVKWLGFLMRGNTNSGNKNLLMAADECAKGRVNEQEQSPLFPWSDSLSVLEALDEVRESGAMRLPSEDEVPSSFPKMMMMASDNSSSYSSAVDSPVEHRRRLSRGSLSSDVAQDDHSSTTILRSQLHELKHVLRQKNALITSLEVRDAGRGGITGNRPKTSGRNSLPAQAKGSQTTSSLALPKLRRTSSLDRTSHVTAPSDDEIPTSPHNTNTPLSDVLNTTANGRDSPISVSLYSRRKRRDANGGGRRSTTPDHSNSLGLSTVREGTGNNLMLLGEGFLAPTIASENRRMATTAGGSGTPRAGTPNGVSGNGLNGLASPILSPGGNGKGTSKVIENLTNELQSSKAALEDAKVQLRNSQKSISTLQRTLDETKAALGRSRTENERLGPMMTRKERQIQEALERARKAEVESKELGKSSREWGARVRKIEAELGEERILKQRAEVQYDAISTNWKQIRESWEKEMIELRQSQGEAVKRNREEVQLILAKSKAAEESWRGREEEGKVMSGIIKELEAERNRATMFVQGPVKELMVQLKEHEQHTSGQDAAVQAVEKELKRILRLMRTPTDAK